MIGYIKHIIVIQSLFNGDKKSGKDLYEDVIRPGIEYRRDGGIKMTHEYFDVSSKKQFVEILKYLDAKSSYVPGGILIHLEMHGSDKQNGLYLSNRDLITLTELVQLFRTINIKNSNRLYISMATCYGRQLYEGVDPNDKSPYSGYISASKEVKTHEVVEDFSELFSRLIESGNLIQAYREATTEHSSFYYKDSKETFRLLMIDIKHRMDHDPSFREEIFGEEIFKFAVENELLTKIL